MAVLVQGDLASVEAAVAAGAAAARRLRGFRGSLVIPCPDEQTLRLTSLQASKDCGCKGFTDPDPERIGCGVEGGRS